MTQQLIESDGQARFFELLEGRCANCEDKAKLCEFFAMFSPTVLARCYEIVKRKIEAEANAESDC